MEWEEIAAADWRERKRRERRGPGGGGARRLRRIRVYVQAGEARSRRLVWRASERLHRWQAARPEGLGAGGFARAEAP